MLNLGRDWTEVAKQALCFAAGGGGVPFSLTSSWHVQCLPQHLCSSLSCDHVGSSDCFGCSACAGGLHVLVCSVIDLVVFVPGVWVFRFGLL